MNAQTFHSKSSGQDNLGWRNYKTTCKFLKYNHSLAYSKMATVQYLHQEHHPGISWLTRQDLFIRNCIWTSVLVTGMQTVMKGKSWSRIGLLISHCLTFVAGAFFVLGVVLGIVDGWQHPFNVTKYHTWQRHLWEPLGTRVGKLETTWAKSRKSPLPYSDYNMKITNFHEPISAMRMEFGIVSPYRMKFSKN